MKIDLNIPLVTLNAEPVKEEGTTEIMTLGKRLAGPLVAATKGDAQKLYGWAQGFYSNKPVEMDKSDCKMLEEFINESEVMTNLMKGQMLNAIDECKKRV